MANLKLSDDWRHEEPLAFLVKNFDTTVHEYKVFAHESEAIRHAASQEEQSDEAGEAGDYEIYPLYAGEVIEKG